MVVAEVARAFVRRFFCHEGEVFWGEELADGAACVAVGLGAGMRLLSRPMLVPKRRA